MSNIVFLEQLDDIIRARIDAADASSSYTAQLASAGITRVAQKVGEEGVEVAIAAAARDDDAALLGEAADLIYHLAVLLARVTQTKGKGDVRYVGVATGMNSLIRPALYGAYHEIVNLSRLDEPASELVTVVGPICETGDKLGTDRLLPPARGGDVLLVANAGAYGAAMASNYNLRTPAEELLLP